MNMSFKFSDCVGISAVAIDAAEFNGTAEVGIVCIGVTADAAGAFGECLIVGLAGEISVLEEWGNRKGLLVRGQCYFFGRGREVKGGASGGGGFVFCGGEESVGVLHELQPEEAGEAQDAPGRDSDKCSCVSFHLTDSEESS